LFLGKLINKLSDKYFVFILTNDIYYDTRNIVLNENIKIINFNFKRNPNLVSDLKILFRLLLFFNKLDNYIVLSLTPKASFLTALSKLLSIKKFKIINYVTGQVWTTKKNFKKLFYKYIDKFTFLFSNEILVDSQSQISYLKKHGFKSFNPKLINKGSICGVNTNKFKKNIINDIGFSNLLKINEDKIKIIYLGRINKDKGLDLLIEAFNFLENKIGNLILIIIGSIIEDNLSELLDNKPNIKFIKRRVNNPEYYLSNSDIFCLPSKREGFGLSVIEASACELPVITSDIYGLNDCMIDGITGFKFDLNVPNDLVSKLEKLITNKQLRTTLGINGRSFVKKNFEEEKVLDFQYKLIKKYI